MSRNIIIYSDGTGQHGGLLFDEPRSNIYKLFRSTRCGPDSTINPSMQAAFYDPGIGTRVPSPGFIAATWNRIYNIVSQALGLGLTGNIVDCYAALVRLWRPGDNIFFFGFSRGAYTVRCLGGVLANCGLPTTMNGEPLKRDLASSKAVAREAVKKVYQHTPSVNLDDLTLSRRQRNLMEQRQILAARFRTKYGSEIDGGPNASPYFIGVFDTVASLANRTATLVFAAIGLVIIGLITVVIWWLRWPEHPISIFFLLFSVVGGSSVLVGILANLWTRIRWEVGLPRAKWWRPFHFIGWKLRFYDRTLSPRVKYARHALAIDERRAAFDRVPWGTPGVHPPRSAGDPEWFQQIWFAGCHSDIGGSYAEEESRLSDVSLEWMLEAAKSVGLHCDTAVLNVWPDPLGQQHDETRQSPFKYAKKIDRSIVHDAPLHPAVLTRLAAKIVMQYDRYSPYRPGSLRDHEDFPK